MNNKRHTIAIIGASGQRRKFGNKAVRAFLEAGFTVYPVNPHEQAIEGVKAYADLGHVPQPVEIVSLYVPPAVGQTLIEDIVAAHPKEVYLNPGAESEKLFHSLANSGIKVRKSCSLVAYRMSPSQFPDY